MENRSSMNRVLAGTVPPRLSCEVQEIMWPFQKTNRVDLTPSKLEGLSWDADKRAGSLQVVSEYVASQA